MKMVQRREGEIPNHRPSHYQRLMLTQMSSGNPSHYEYRVRQPRPSCGSENWKSGTWLAGGLFAIESAFGMDFLNTFATTVDIDLTGSIHLWGEPFRPEEWVGVEISLYDAEQEYPVYTFSQLSNGLISTNVDTGIDWFFAEPTNHTVNTSGRHPRWYNHYHRVLPPRR